MTPHLTTLVLLLGTAGCVAAQQPPSQPPISPPAAFLLRIPVGAPTAELRTGVAQPLVGELRVPDGTGPFPVAILVHGGCFNSQWGFRGQYLRPMAEALRTQDGIATWIVRYRGADEPGGGWPGTFADVAAAADSLRALARRYPLDTTRIVAVGHSAGSVLAAWLAARALRPGGDGDTAAAVRGRAPIAVKGVVNVDGPPTFLAARASPDPRCGAQLIDGMFGGDPAAQPERWRAASAERWLADVPPRVRQAVVVADTAAPERADVTGRSLAAYGLRSGAAVFFTGATHHFSMLDPGERGWEAVRSAVRHALGP